MIYEIKEPEFAQKARGALLRLCGNDSPDPWHEPFGSNVKHKMIVYPYSYVPDRRLWEILKEHAGSVGERGFFVSIQNRPPEQNRRQPYHWFVEFNGFERFEEANSEMLFANVVYSERGTWGIVSSYEDHGLLGGPVELLVSVNASIPNAEQMKYEFVKNALNWEKRYKTKIDWLPNLLTYVYGEDEAGTLMRSVKSDAN